MLTNKRYPEILYADELDAYLERGWYRMGQSIFTTHFLYFDHSVYSAIWVRLNVDEHRFRKSARKIMNRNGKQFDVVFRQGFISSEKENLFQKYKNNFSGRLSNNLKEYLLDGEDYNIYNTLEAAIYDNNQLIGFSFFDIGKQSVASIMGVYDPDYSKASLGFYTMLVEIEFCKKNNIQFYYPGYIVPGYDRFDYKLRIGDVEYFDLSAQKWISYEAFDENKTPTAQIFQKLELIQDKLLEDGYDCQLLTYPFFEAGLSSFWQAPFLDYPIILILKSTPYYVIVSYDVVDECYYLLQCSPFNHKEFYFSSSFLKSLNPLTHLPDVLIVEKYLASGKRTDFIIDSIKVKLFKEH